MGLLYKQSDPGDAAGHAHPESSVTGLVAGGVPVVGAPSSGDVEGVSRGGTTALPTGMDNAGVPTMQRNMEMPVFEDFLVSAAAGFTAYATSEPIPAFGNAAALAAQVTFSTPGSSITVSLQGSYNRRVWYSVGSVTIAGNGVQTASATQLLYAWLRLVVEETVVGELGRVHAEIVMGHL